MKLSIALLCLFSLFSSNAAGDGVNRAEFVLVKEALYKTFDILNSNPNEKLTINKPIPGLEDTYWWDIDMVHASYVHIEEEDGSITHNIYLMGGFARQDGMTPDGLLVTGCHEIGHGIGGDPRKNPSAMSDFQSSTEGQADYFATAVCLPIALSFMTAMRPLNVTEIYKKYCANFPSHLGAPNFCLRMLNALESDVAYFNSYLASGEGQVSFDLHSTHIQEELNLEPTYYPDSQCRLDTMVNGIFGLERPECWYPGGEENGLLWNQL